MSDDSVKKNKIESILIKNSEYSWRNNKYFFLEKGQFDDKSSGGGVLGAIQEYLKKWGGFYYILIEIFSPVMPSLKIKKEIKSLLTRYKEQNIILNLGSGPVHFQGRKDIINVDIFDFKEVDIIADASRLPVEDGSVDCIINVAMLEHVEAPEKHIEEMHRVLRPGGEVLCYIPFIVPYHAAPHDYYRWTAKGANSLFRIFSEGVVETGCGSTSALLWVFQEWLASLLAFGQKNIRDILFIIVMLLTFPLKYLDLIIPDNDKVASGFFIIAKK